MILVNHPHRKRIRQFNILLVYRDERVQRGDHVRLRSRHFVHSVRPAGRILHHHIDLHHFLHHGHPLPRLRAKGTPSGRQGGGFFSRPLSSR